MSNISTQLRAPIIFLVLLFQLIVLVPVTSANEYKTADVIVLLSKDSKPYHSFKTSLVRKLSDKGYDKPSIYFLNISEYEKSIDKLTDLSTKLIIAVGSKAVDKIISLDLKSPVICTLIPKITFDRLLNKHKISLTKSNISAIYLDQPLRRQFNLIQATIPKSSSVGVIVSDSSESKINELKRSARKTKLTVNIEKLTSGGQLVATLKKVLGDSEVLLTIADPNILNRRTARNLLLTTYIQKVPVIAYSRSYVKAGALAAVYSTPEQLGKQAAEEIIRMVKTGIWGLRKPLYPVDYSVAVNKKVARSLGFTIAAESEIRQRIIDLSKLSL